MCDNFEKVFEEMKQVTTSWGVEPTFTKIRKNNYLIFGWK